MQQGRLRGHMGTDFTEGSIMPMLLRFMLPFLLASILNSLYNTVDTIIIGRFFGSVGIVSVNMGGRMLNLFTQISMTLAGGGQVLIAQQFGAKRRDELNATIGTLFTEMFVISAVMAVGTFLCSSLILHALNTPEASFAGALSYLRITCIGLPLIFGYNATFNLIGDFVFVKHLHMGAPGTAIATVLGQGLSLVFSLIVLYRKRERFGFDFKLKSFAVDWGKLWIMLKIGFPMTLRALFINITQMFMLRYVNAYGLVESAAYAICDKIIHLTNIFTTSARQAAGGMIGQNIGAKKPERVVIIVRCCATVTLTAAAVLAASGMLFPRAYFGLFDQNPDVLAYAQPFMNITALIYLLGGLMAPFESVVSGTGHSMLGFLGGMLDGVVFRIGFSFLFAWALGMGVTGFLLGDALARLGPIIVSGSYYLSGAWRRRKRLVSGPD